MGRNLLTILLTIFVPTVLLNMISYSTNFFKPFFFEASVTVNLTAMLVLTTLFINVSVLLSVFNWKRRQGFAFINFIDKLI